ncbi:MAG: CtsR family transcriptional regulator [Clostridia bacterium]|nr:CtsR family transcriptional regulator [Clostridia bacterium]
MRLSDIIAAEINRMLDESSNNTAEIQRNDFASRIGCVPSQINYVLSSRFIPEHGYMVESRRGGGGFIKITRVRLDGSSAIMHLVNVIGNEIDDNTVRVILDNCCDSGLLEASIVKMMYSAVSAPVMREIPVVLRDCVRAAIIKQMLLSQV